jgi:glycosyltransferase involved in cell wall biosynthesis
MKIISPMASGNGAYIIHRILGNKIPNYHICGYNPYWTLCPPALPFLCRRQGIPDLIHTTPDYAAFFKRGKIPLIITFHNFVLDKEAVVHGTLLQRIHHQTDLRFFIRKALSAATVVTAVSHFTAKLVKKELGCRSNIQVIYNGVDVNKFTPLYSSKTSSKEIRVFFSGNLTQRKGAHWLPSISRQLSKNVHLYYTQGLRTQNIFPSSTGLYPVGSVHFEDMPDRYNEMNILVMPSVREGFGLAIAEAMSCGLPVVASNCSSIPELIDDGKGGFLCPVGDIEAFAEKINLLADSPKLRHEMGEYNRAKVEKMFTLDRMVNEYRELFKEMLD